MRKTLIILIIFLILIIIGGAAGLFWYLNQKDTLETQKIEKSIQDVRLRNLEDKNSSIDSDSNMEDFYSPTGRPIDRKLQFQTI